MELSNAPDFRVVLMDSMRLHPCLKMSPERSPWDAMIQAIPLNFQTQIARSLIEADPLALLCQRVDCERCNAIRSGLAKSLPIIEQ